MTVSPWWSAYAVVLAVLVVWIKCLSEETDERDAATDGRERDS